MEEVKCHYQFGRGEGGGEGALGTGQAKNTHDGTHMWSTSTGI